MELWICLFLSMTIDHNAPTLRHLEDTHQKMFFMIFMDGPTLMKYAKNEGTVDGCHTNDLSFHSMAAALIPQLRSLI